MSAGVNTAQLSGNYSEVESQIEGLSVDNCSLACSDMDGHDVFVGLDVGNSNHTLALVLLSGEMLVVRRGCTVRDGGPVALLESLDHLMPDLLDEAKSRNLHVGGLGVGFGGPVDAVAGVVRLSHQNAGWESYPLRDRLEERFDIPVTLDNDANAGGWGEYCFGAGRGAQDMVYYNIGTGIGGAVILDGKLRRGPATMAGELGHTTVDPHGPDCTCGQRGCLEAMASGPAIDRHIRRLQIPWSGRMAHGTDLFPMVEEGQPQALIVLEEVVMALSLSIRNVLHLLNPERVVLGGGVSGGGTLLLAPLRERVRRLTFHEAFESCTITSALLGYEAGVVGAAALCMGK